MVGITYYLYISRAEQRHHAGTHPITEAEWESVADVHPLLFRTSPASVTPSVYASTFPDGTDAYLSWEGGLVLVEGVNTNENASRLAPIAMALGAHLVGEEGESYLPGA